jgi:hypothetical protein
MSKAIERFVRRAIRDSDEPDERNLRSLLAELPTPELQMFWLRFTFSRASSVASATVSHWKTREQDAVFHRESRDHQFYPNQKDFAGKYVIVRSELEDHITSRLLDHIANERHAARAFRSAPLFERLYAWLGMAIVFALFLAIPAAICVVILGAVLHRDLWRIVTVPAVSVFIAAWSTYLVFGLLQPLFRRFTRRDD